MAFLISLYKCDHRLVFTLNQQFPHHPHPACSTASLDLFQVICFLPCHDSLTESSYVETCLFSLRVHQIETMGQRSEEE